ncbi:sporulation related protein [Blastomonas natatoria]|uniref:Sporulation related protein n=1 Tax=Blastomonas natatoria TaxID=34015 RepID=A0A2V3UY73_9SPHN|nr:SPOR domain-containing protein [Blastomonas natatoria]PXW74372.1 sporulation related protein [Blastomonas natatoria]
MAFNPLLRTRKMRLAALLCAAASVSLTPAHAQEEGPDAPDTGYNSLEVAQPKGTRELQNALQRLAVYPGDVDALIDAGNAALLLQDPQAAIGFFARAEEMSPGNGRIKAGLGSALLLNENPYEALRLFDEAKKLGVPETVYAADRGLAYDLVGNFNAAQDDYELALRRGGDDETIRRYALSLGISGDRAGAEAQLDPLLRKRDAAAWRTRAFVLAIAGDADGAIAIADATMPKRMAASIEPFFRFMGRLTPAQQAAAAHFGQFPAAAAMGKDDPRNRQYAALGTQRPRPGRADAGLIPAGDPLGPATDTKSRKLAKVDKSQRRRPGKLSKKEREAIALAQAEAAAKPVPVQARAPGPVPPPDLLIPGRGGPTPSPAASTVQTARATVQPLPGQTASAPSRATVQGQSSDLVSARPRGSMSSPSPTPAAPVRVVSAPPSVSRTNGGQTSLPSPQSLLPPADSPVQAAAAVAQPTGGQAEALAQSAVNPSTPMIGAGDRPVLLSGVNELPRPGFSSVPAAAVSGLATAATPVQGPGQGFDLAQVTGRTTDTPAGTQSPAPGTIQPTSPAPASSGPAALASAASGQPVPAEPEPARVTLASVIASISVPPSELALAEDAVDVTKLQPMPKLPDEKALAAKKAEEDRKLAEAKAAEEKKLADRKLAERKAADEKKLAEKKAAEKKAAAAKKAAPKHPKRYWVQVAGGANRADLSKEWKRLTTTSPALFKGKQGWWTPLNATNRLLTGPFKSSDEAQAFVNTLAKNKLSGFPFTSSEGQEVTALGK